MKKFKKIHQIANDTFEYEYDQFEININNPEMYKTFLFCLRKLLEQIRKSKMKETNHIRLTFEKMHYNIVNSIDTNTFVLDLAKNLYIKEHSIENFYFKPNLFYYFSVMKYIIYQINEQLNNKN